MESSTLTNKLDVLLLSSGVVDDAFTGTDTHRLFQTMLHTRDASCALRRACLTIAMRIKQKFFNQAETQTVPCLRRCVGRQLREFRCRGMPSPRNRGAFAVKWGSPRTTSAPLMLSSDLPPGTLRAATRRASSSRGVPRTPRTTSDDRSLKRSAPLWDRMTQAAGRTACLSLSMRLDPPRCLSPPRSVGLPVGLTARLLAGLRGPAERSVFSPSTAAEIYPFPRLAAPKSPTRVPVTRNPLGDRGAPP
ncbi:hypothetical protein TcCL_NonESM10616 [Trypanosoma cruzi]|uniref:Uncharacterized protein n=1 Tax=Trypanosoma cruzi (strain CL Brener) TaxID=353153 RepID=Q4DPK0_TRYCC|nr:hypothetical protein Tc00.1047053506613.80 [Trypanosoma cruzi]EAN94455.1 hypothetical protein Tc00.1047053506613.80 [Trypanosoma cruzi]RNC39965.1 hypothetical protein TcCL_NonESM10616 [Trypanosoma cruzi]|eukprot:XP_816306.1 hypothetical protein [Trypanosoma cruzi strain CL Brener]